MGGSRRRKLEQTVALLQQQYGDHALRRASELHIQAVPHITTGFDELDALTGCGGVPQGWITLLSGRTTSGKLTLAYKTLLHAQAEFNAGVALVDLTRSSDPDYLARCGVDLNRLLFARPQSGEQAVELLLDLARSRRFRAILLDGLAEIAGERRQIRTFNRNLAGLQRYLRASGSALLIVDELQPPWKRWLGLQASFDVEQWAALHISLERERWLDQGERLRGYRARARLLKSRWARRGGRARLEIRFNGTVESARTW